MKKNLLFLFALICSMSLFTACDNDDDKVTLQDLSKEYSGENLSLKLDDAVVTGKTVKFEAKSGLAGVITLNDIVSELPSLSVDLTLTAVKDGYSFEGSKEVTGYVVSVSGTLTNDSKLTVSIITKGWELEKNQYTAENLALKVNGKEVADQSVTFNITSPTEANLVLKNLFEGVEQDFTVPVKMIIATTRAENAAKVYSFKGEDESVPGYVIMASGTIATDGQLTLDVQAGGWKALKETYSYADENLVFVGGDTDNDAVIRKDRIVKFIVDPASNGTKATLSLGKNLLEFDLSDVKDIEVVLTRDGVNYKVEGKTQYTNYLTLEVTGEVSADGLNLTLDTPTFKEQREALVGTWKLNQVDGMGDTTLKWATKTGAFALSDGMKGFLANLITDPGILQIVNTPIADETINGLGILLSQYALSLNSIEFGEFPGIGINKNGEIKITYTELGTTTPKVIDNLLRYQWTINGLHINLNSEGLMAMMPTPTSILQYRKAGTTVDIMTEGIPFNCSIKDNVLSLSITDKEVLAGTIKDANSILGMAMFSSEELMKLLLPVIEQNLIPKLAQQVSDEVTTFEAGINFTK